jgi:hypothetical protein
VQGRLVNRGKSAGLAFTRRRPSALRIRCSVHRRAGQGDGGCSDCSDCIKLQASSLAAIEMLEEGSPQRLQQVPPGDRDNIPHAVLLRLYFRCMPTQSLEFLLIPFGPYVRLVPGHPPMRCL